MTNESQSESGGVVSSTAVLGARFGFTDNNKYFGFPVFTWNLPSGFTCPGALECLAYADRKTGKIKNGEHQTFKCYSATTERYPAVREKAWHNFEAVRGKTPEAVAETLLACWPEKATHVRIHAGGDFFSQDYFDGWLEVCRQRPSVKFWAFTKSVPFWLARQDQIPFNLCLQASYGGKHDALIKQHGLKFAKVVYSKQEAESIGLEIDTDDRLAISGNESFALFENQTRRKKQRTPEGDLFAPNDQALPQGGAKKGNDEH